jgi:hypothetical protein
LNSQKMLDGRQVKFNFLLIRRQDSGREDLGQRVRQEPIRERGEYRNRNTDGRREEVNDLRTGQLDGTARGGDRYRLSQQEVQAQGCWCHRASASKQLSSKIHLQSVLVVRSYAA